MDVIVHVAGDSKTIRMLVNTGSTYIVLSPTIIRELGLYKTPYSVKLTLAVERKVKAKLYLTEVEVKGRKGPAFVAELEMPTPLLGVYALETLGFKIDSLDGRARRDIA